MSLLLVSIMVLKALEVLNARFFGVQRSGSGNCIGLVSLEFSPIIMRVT